MEWQQLIGFYHVVESGGFTKAAEMTYRTQSAVSQQIKKLEEELGCQLLERPSKRKFLLTPAGDILFAFTKKFLADYEVLLEQIDDLKGLKKGRLHIAGPFTTLSQLLPSAIKSFINEYPGVELSLFDRPQQEVLDLVYEGKIDLGIALESSVPSSMEKVRWKKVETVLLIPLKHPLLNSEEVTLEQIPEYPLIMPPKESIAYKKLATRFEEKGLAYRVVMESSNIELSAVYVEMGLGIAFATIVGSLPALAKRDFKVVPLGQYFDDDHLSFVYRKEKAFKSVLTAFINKALCKPRAFEPEA